MKRSQKIQSFILKAAFVLYLLVLSYLVFFRYRMVFYNGDFFAMRSLNLIPFKTIWEYLTFPFNSTIPIHNLLGNIVMFIPLGTYLRLFMADKKWTNSFLWVIVSTVAIESLQFTFAIGSCDIDDVLLNSLGGIIGILLYHGIFRLLKDDKKVRTVFSVLSFAGIVPVFIGLVVLISYNF